ncbi:MAG TPA: amidase family protein [Hyphomonadaceae bacterium]|nr:amidase family protein [Hyphomonadaceae bacterium]
MTPAPEIFESARELTAKLARGELSAADLLEAQIARHEAVDPVINAVVRTDLPAARARAKELDRQLKSEGPAGPLHGLPITIKDTFDVEGMPATSGAPEYANRPAKTPDAAAVARLRAAGAVIWGKTNTPYLAGDNQTFNQVHGRTSNPWDISRTPGGSSGGAAAALATGITPLELGSDIGGSLRLPAHFCGVAALKPTFGRAPILGHVPPAPGSLSVRDLNVAGPMARNVGDLRLMLNVLTADNGGPQKRPSLKSRRIALWTDEPSFPLSAECRGAVETAAEAAAEAGAQVMVAKPGVDGGALIDLYLQLLLPILATDMPTTLVKAMEVGRPIARMMARGEPFSRGKWALYSAATHHDWLRADESRQRLKRRVAEFFTRWHAIITPIAPSTAFEHIETGDAVTRLLAVDGQPTPYHAFHSWIALATVCHLPAAVVPVPRKPGELPCGVQIIGPEGGDHDVLAIAEALEAELGGFQRPPEDNLARPLELTQKTGKRPPKPVKAAKPPKPAKPVKTKPQKPAKPKPAPKPAKVKPAKPARK